MSKIAEVLEQLDEQRARIARVEAAITEIGHNGGPPLDQEPLDDAPPPPRHKPVLISDRQVAQRYDVVVRTLERWDEQPELGFPPPVRINRRRYRELAALEAWDRANALKAVAPRAGSLRQRKPATTESREATLK